MAIAHKKILEKIWKKTHKEFGKAEGTLISWDKHPKEPNLDAQTFVSAKALQEAGKQIGLKLGVKKIKDINYAILKEQMKSLDLEKLNALETELKAMHYEIVNEPTLRKTDILENGVSTLIQTITMHKMEL